MKNANASLTADEILSPLLLGEVIPQFHLVGIGGIGMSALASLLKYFGAEVSGSDRALEDPANSRIFNALRAEGVRLFTQDGSYFDEGKPDALVSSTAIEADNPDFMVSGDSIPLIHRADMLSAAINFLNGRTTIAVAGSCGKTSVTAWLAETLVNLGCDPLMVGGGLSNSFVSSEFAGNFRPGEGEYVVFEADESDKSLLRYSPDYALILNIGTDHYPKEELIALFSEFLGRTRKGCVLSREVREMLGESATEHLRVAVFDSFPSEASFPFNAESHWTLDEYSPRTGVFSRFLETRMGTMESDSFSLSLPASGRHTAANAMAVMAMVDMLERDDPLTPPVAKAKRSNSGFEDGSEDDSDSSIGESACEEDANLNRISRVVSRDWNASSEALSSFGGVWRRFDTLGFDVNGAEVCDDYAHNVDKIVSAINTAHETATRVVAVFQPHGFKPLGFMRGELFEKLESTLASDDLFCFLPVFYAGGTSSFKPTAEEVSVDFNEHGSKKYHFFKTRGEIVFFLQHNTLRTDMVLIMGARDNSLSDFASKIVCKKHIP